MLNHSDYFISHLEFPYEPECGWSVNVSFLNRKNGKKSLTMFAGRDDWMKVADQCKVQVRDGHYYKVSWAPKPKVRAVVEAAPVKGKGKKAK